MKADEWCANCKLPRAQHAQDKCLFSSTAYRQMNELEYLRFCVGETVELTRTHEKQMEAVTRCVVATVRAHKKRT